MGLIGWLVAIGCMFISVAVGVWGLTEFNRLVAIWAIGVPGVLFLVFAGGFELQKFALEANTSQPNYAEAIAPRAYVGVVAFHVVGFRVGEPIQAQIVFSNAGPTPAYNVKFRFSRMDIDEFPPPVYVPTPLPPDTETGGATIAPKGTQVVSPSRSRPLDDIELHALQPNTRVISNAIYIQGVLTYRDVFKVLRTTRFYGAYGGPFGINQTGAVQIMDGPGNESD